LLVPASRPANRTVLGRLESAGEPSPVTLEPVDTGDYDDPAYPPPRPRIRRAVFWRCLFCGERVRPVVRGEISQTGWIVFIVVLLFFFPLCWIGLLMKEEYRFCPECGCKLGSTVQTSFG
jgi:hypothetical protein